MDEEDSTSYERTMAEEASQESTSSVKRDDEKDISNGKLSDDDSLEGKRSVGKHKRLILEDDSDDEPDRNSPRAQSPDSNTETAEISRNRKRIIDDDSDEEKEDESTILNSSKKIMGNLKSLCDEDSSDDDRKSETEDNDSEAEERSARPTLDTSEEDSNSHTETSPKEKKKGLQRKAKTEAENVISMIQKNARDEALTVPYHCPEQKSLKDFLESLKNSKAKLVAEEKVEIKTHKFKLLQDLPKVERPETNADIDVGEESSEAAQKDDQKREKMTLKGDPNSMIDLETGQTFTKKTVADTLLNSLFRNNRNGLRNENNPKFKPEPVPGAPLKELKKCLESELERKRKETILKILDVEKVEKDEEEEILEDDEYEIDSDDETKKRKIKRTPKEAEEKEEGENKLESTIFNEDEEMEEPNIPSENEEEGEDEDDTNDEDSDSDDDLEENVEKKSLKRIVTMADSDEEDVQVQTELPSTSLQLEDIPTEVTNQFGFSATQNDDELFALCSGKFTTQLPSTGVESSQINEASQVKDFEFPSATPIIPTPELEDETEDVVAGPRPEINFSSSDEEEDGAAKENGDARDKMKKRQVRRKKRIFIEAAEDEDELPPKPNESDEEEDDDNESVCDEEEEVDILPAEAIEELEEYKSFLTGSKKPDTVPKQERLKVTDFLEKEAELSDSEWGSEDEDERDLDRIEDIGLVKDDDDFDGEALRDEVGRIHMRQMVNEDNRELKYLKDLILNEEEVDGQGRQRTFRWLNVNNDEGFGDAKQVADVTIAGGDAENQSSDEEENEANWRKLRLEREKALQEASTNKDSPNVTIQTRLETVMRATRDIRVVKPMSSGETVLKENSSPSFLMQDQSKKYMNLRQSFLLRDEETLNRLATISAKADGTSVSDGKQNFVFRRIEETTNTPTEMEPPKKRKSNGFPTGGGATAAAALKKRKV